jgi:hypothetical protein
VFGSGDLVTKLTSSRADKENYASLRRSPVLRRQWEMQLTPLPNWVQLVMVGVGGGEAAFSLLTMTFDAPAAFWRSVKCCSQAATYVPPENHIRDDGLVGLC